MKKQPLRVQEEILVSSPSAQPSLSPIARNFSRAASFYQQHARLQLDIAKKLAGSLLPSFRSLRVLELGCGTGFLTRELLSHYPKAHVDAIDIAPQMIEQAREIFRSERRVSWTVEDARCYLEHLGTYDLIASSSAFHWMFPLSKLFENLRRLLRRRGLLSFSLMHQGTLEELHALREEIAPGKGRPVLLPTENELRSALKTNGFALRQAAVDSISLNYESTDQMLRNIHQLGFTTSNVSLKKTLLNRSELRSFLREYQRRHGNEMGHVSARFVVGYYEAIAS